MMMTIIHCADGWMETSTESTFDYTGDYNGQLLLCALNGEEPGSSECPSARRSRATWEWDREAVKLEY